MLSGAEMMMAVTVGGRRRVECLVRGWTRENVHGPDRWSDNIEGAAGELAVAKHLGVFWSASINTFHLPDVGDYQVRSMGHDHYGLVLRDDDADDQCFILAVGKAPRFRVPGWIWGVEGKRDEWKAAPNGGRVAFFVPQDVLHDMELLGEARP